MDTCITTLKSGGETPGSSGRASRGGVGRGGEGESVSKGCDFEKKWN
jgi:hypothetical protein